MEYRFLGKSGLRVSALSYGSWVTFHTQADENNAYELMKTAYDKGINFFDNAEAYAEGNSEIIMGYRSLTYARRDNTNLPMYDHDEYIKAGNFDTLNSSLLIKHYAVVRESNLLLFKRSNSCIFVSSIISSF